MVRNTDVAYGFAGKGGKQPRTDFSEFQVPFTIINGIVQTEKTKMASSLFNIQAKGKADLLNETLDFRIVPTVVTTRKEDKEAMKRSEVMIPVLVGGSFSSPKFRPDLKGIAEKELEEKVFQSSDFKKLFEKEELKPFEKDAKKLLKGILNNPTAPGKDR
jgi:AsmA protein